MNLRIFDDESDLLQSAGRAILHQAQSGMRTIAISGGATPQPLYEMLGRSEELRALPLIWVLVDERYVPVDHPQSNAGMIQRTLFAPGMAPQHRFLRFRTDFPEPAESALAFEREWRELGIDRLDLVLLGMGDDGHTASLFPGTAALDVEDRIATEVFVPRLQSWRVTLTKPVLRAAQMRMVLVAGASKRPVLEKVRMGGDYPIARVTKGTETWWFVDRLAVDIAE